MAYQINKSDGSVVATVADGQIDDYSTGLTLIGKNYSGFGEALNENFIKLLENFANTGQPENPIRGQVWFDTSELKLKVYTGVDFAPVSSATIANTQPNTLGIGDLWYNDVAQQLYFFDGTSTILLAPIYSATQGKSGLEVQSILDTLNQTRVVTYLWNNGTLLGIFAVDSFTPKNAITGFSGSIVPGFNAGSLSGIKFNVTCTNAEQLGGSSSDVYVRRNTAQEVIQGALTITTDTGLTVGGANQAELTVSNSNVFLTNSAADRALTLRVVKGITREAAINIDASTRTINLYSAGLAVPTPQVNVNGNLTVTGDLTVEGTTTTINTATLTVEDKNIELASGSTSDVDADGAGLTVRGTTNHTLTWNKDDGSPTGSDRWTSSDDFNLATGKAFYINGVKVLDGTSLGPSITNVPGVTAFTNTLANVKIGPNGALSDPYLKIENNRISTLVGTSVPANLDIELDPIGTGNVSVSGSKIINLADPTSAQDAATKNYVDTSTSLKPLVFSMDLSDSKSNAYIISNILNNLAPAASYVNGTQARILCTLSTINSTTLSFTPLINTTSNVFNLSGGGVASALTGVGITDATITGGTLTLTRVVKIFQISLGNWIHISDTILPP